MQSLFRRFCWKVVLHAPNPERADILDHANQELPGLDEIPSRSTGMLHLDEPVRFCRVAMSDGNHLNTVLARPHRIISLYSQDLPAGWVSLIVIMSSKLV
jgi:hypothetical protein